MLKIYCSKTYQPEREYICHVIFKEFLGLEYCIQYTDRNDWCIQGEDGATLILPDILFQTPNVNWLTPDSLPKQPLNVWDTRIAGIDFLLVDPKLPIIYGDPKHLLPQQKSKKNKRRFSISLDILGSAFFMLTCYEEVVKSDRDEHDRFPAKASLAYQEGFLDRPIVNEYLEILWFYLKQIKENQKRKTKNFQIIPTHDVDAPFDYFFRSPLEMIRRLGGDIILRKNPILAAKNLARYVQIKKTGRDDPFDSFDLIMDISEQAGLKSAFFFMAGGESRYESPYPLDHPAIQDRINNILDRGHEIGFHPSYNAGLNQNLWMHELECLRRFVSQAEIVGGREHYLRFEVPKTWRFWNDAGMGYDSTLSFADHAGFRCGTCYPYPVFDLEKRQELSVWERPLIVMECTVLDKRYMGITEPEKAWNYMHKLKERCRMFGGDFVVLWHNSRFVEEKERRFYKEIVV